MKLSAKARYAVLALTDLAMYSKKAEGKECPIALAEIADRQNISQQYLEQLFSKLKQANIVKSMRGQNGGYFLTCSAKDILVSQVIDAVDETIQSTTCKPNSQKSCQGKSSKCLTHKLWTGMDITIRTYLHAISLEDIIEQRPLPLTTLSLPHTKTHQTGNFLNAF